MAGCVCCCQAKCGVHCPLGDEIYRDRKLSVYVVDGGREPAYCRTLCILAAMFGALSCHPAVQISYTFYVLTQNDRHGCHLVAFFSSVSLLCCENNVKKIHMR